MLKRIFSYLLVPALLTSVVLCMPMAVSATAPVYELVQNFEDSTSANVQTGDLVIAGEKSYVFTTGSGNFIDLGALPAPTIENAAGVFIRYELTQALTENGGFLGSPQPTASAAWSQITDKNGLNPINGVLASIFAPYFTITPAGYVFLEYLPETMSGGVALGLNISYAGIPDGVTLIFDDIGYYTGTDFAAIAAAVNADIPTNPMKLINVATSLPGNHVLMTHPDQMTVNVLHGAGAVIKWEIDDTAIATIDADTGAITPVSKGTATVTAYVESDETIMCEGEITVADGFIDVTCKDTENGNDTIFGLKPRLRAAPYYKGPATTVVWSIVSGPATIARDVLLLFSGDADLAILSQTVNIQTSILTFTGSGTVVVRAALETDTSIYTDYTFNVAGTFKDLQALILDAQGMDPNQFTAAKWAAILAACDEANAMIDEGTEGITQDQINAQMLSLQNVIDGVEETDNPETGDGVLGAGTLIALLVCAGLALLRQRKVSAR